MNNFNNIKRCEICPEDFEVKKELNEIIGTLPCRICLMEEYTLENPLISVCKCSGTMK